MDKQYDWTSFTVRVNINATKDKVYRMWASMAGMEMWFLKLCAYKKSETEWYAASELVPAGTAYTFMWYGWSDDVIQKGKLTEANGVDKLIFTFGQAEAEDMICEVLLTEEQGETICAITQSKIPETEVGKTYYHIGSLQGWTFYLANLKSALEGGIDLRNKNELIKNVLNC